MAAPPARRPLHYVFKVGNRAATTDFYRRVLGMTYLRHEEFDQGCEATCNGPYDGHWSKSMVGYGAEDSHFVVELTYNYGIGSYAMGNDFKEITIKSPEVYSRACAASPAADVETKDDASVTVRSPDGHRFRICNAAAPGSDPVVSVGLAVTDVETSLAFWRGVLGMSERPRKAEGRAVLGFGDGLCELELAPLPAGTAMDRAKAFGRTAFACPAADLPAIQRAVEAAVAGGKLGAAGVKTPLISLDTPGKAQVQVVILTDPDGHEICFVGDEAFRELSAVDAKADELLDAAMAADKSDEWFESAGKSKKHEGAEEVVKKTLL